MAHSWAAALRSLAGGATIQTIAIKDLREFQIPIPSAVEKGEVETEFHNRQACLAEVHAILTDIENSRGSTWPHKDFRG